MSCGDGRDRERGFRVPRVLMMNRVLRAQTAMVSTLATGQLELGIFDAEHRLLFGLLFGLVQYVAEVSIWAVVAGGSGQASPWSAVPLRHQPLPFGAAFSCTRCAADYGTLSRLLVS